MTKEQIENLIEKVNKAFNVDLRSKKTTRLNAYLKMIIVSKSNLHETILAKVLNRDRVTILYYRERFEENKNYYDFKELINKVEAL